MSRGRLLYLRLVCASLLVIFDCACENSSAVTKYSQSDAVAFAAKRMALKPTSALKTVGQPFWTWQPDDNENICRAISQLTAKSTRLSFVRCGGGCDGVWRYWNAMVEPINKGDWDNNNATIPIPGGELAFSNVEDLSAPAQNFLRDPSIYALAPKFQAVTLHTGAYPVKDRSAICVPATPTSPKLNNPKSIVPRPGGLAVLDRDLDNPLAMRVYEAGSFGDPALATTVTMDPPVAKEADLPWGMTFRADMARAFAGANGIYFRGAAEAVAHLTVKWPSDPGFANELTKRGCCDIGWLMDPVAGGAFFVNRGDHIEVYDDYTFEKVASWKPKPLQNAQLVYGIAGMSASATDGSLTLVEWYGDVKKPKSQVTIYGFGLIGAPLGSPWPKAWQANKP